MAAHLGNATPWADLHGIMPFFPLFPGQTAAPAWTGALTNRFSSTILPCPFGTWIADLRTWLLSTFN
jgi:hypothetical protein